MRPIEELESRLEQYNLLVVKDYVLSHAVEVLAFTLGDAPQTAGQSKVGGQPDLPPDLAWPDVDGHPMVFVAQLNLAEVAPLDPYGLLPKSGMLYFFFGNDEPSTRMPHEVLYVESAVDLAPAPVTAPPLYTRTKPHLFGADAQNPSPFHPFALEPRKGLNIPPLPYAEEALDALTDTIEDDELAENLPEVYEMLASEIDGNWICKTYGYAEEHNGDIEYEAALRIHADKTYDCFKDSALQTLTEHFNDPQRALQAVKDAILLLEVRSDCHTGFLWGNNGVIHFLIDRQDLLARRFDRVYCELTYS